MRKVAVQLWQRDIAMLGEIKRSPMLTSQLSRLLGFPSAKKASERFHLLHNAGLVKQVAFLQRMQGRAELAQYLGACPAIASLRHTILIAEVRVQSQLSLPEGLTAQFFYGHEL